MKKILILSGSPRRNGNTEALVEWFTEGARSKGAKVEVVHTAFLKYKSTGCTSCRACQKIDKYECVIDDEAKPVLAKMAKVDVIVMATPLYFFGPSAQLKLVFDRMFSLYKWDNEADTMKSPLKGKMLVLLASAYEDVGLKALERPFRITADYTKMKFKSFLVPNAGVSGDIREKAGIRDKAIFLGKNVAGMENMVYYYNKQKGGGCMKKWAVVLIAFAVLMAGIAPVMAETVFNEASKNISTWKNPFTCKPCPTKTEQAPATAQSAKAMCKTDVLGTMVPTGTVK